MAEAFGFKRQADHRGKGPREFQTWSEEEYNRGRLTLLCKPFPGPTRQRTVSSGDETDDLFGHIRISEVTMSEIEAVLTVSQSEPDGYRGLLMQHGAIPDGALKRFPMPIFEGANAPAKEEIEPIVKWLTEKGLFSQTPAYDDLGKYPTFARSKQCRAGFLLPLTGKDQAEWLCMT